MKTKILIVTDSAAMPTGMAEVTRLIFEGLMRFYPDQYEIEQLGLNHIYAVHEPKWKVHATKTSSPGKLDESDRAGEKSFHEVCDAFKPDVVWAFNDPHRLDHICVPPGQRKHKLVVYTTIDGFPVPPEFGFLTFADKCVMMSHFAREVFLRGHHDHRAKQIEVIYSPADTERFHPVSEDEKAEIRAGIFPEWMPLDSFVLGWVGRNQWRKQNWLAYQVISHLRHGTYMECVKCDSITILESVPMPFKEKKQIQKCRMCDHSGSIHKARPMDNIFLWVHHSKEDRHFDWPYAGLEIPFNVHQDRDVYYTEGLKHKAALTPDTMPLLYQAWDVLLYLSGGEGFGVPVWEAMSSALPVIYSDYSSHAELLRRCNSGCPVDGILQPESGTCIWRMVANVETAISAVLSLYRDRVGEKLSGRRSRAFAKTMGIAAQAEKWHNLFREINQ